jgi:hypothetical protein
LGDQFAATRRTQIVEEVTDGTPLPATLQVAGMTFTMDPQFGVTVIKGDAQRFAAEIEPDGQETVTGKIAGQLTFTEILYALDMIWGRGVLSTPAGATNARQWRVKPPIVGKVPARALTVEQGDSDDAERTSYTKLTDIGFDLSRAASLISGSTISRAIEKAGSGSWTGMTANPTQVPLKAVLPKKWDAYMDLTSATLGSTKVSDCFKTVFGYGGAFVPYFPMDSSLVSFRGLADGETIAASATFTLMKNPLVGEALWVAARNGDTRYLRVKATGDLIDNSRGVSISGTATSGTFTITFKGVTSAAISWNSTLAAFQTILDNMSSIGPGNSVVTGGPLPATPFSIDFSQGALHNESALITIGVNSLAGTTPSPAFASVQIPYSLQIDCVGAIMKPGGDQSVTSVRVRDWDFQILADPAWLVDGTGTAMVVTVVNNMLTM